MSAADVDPMGEYRISLDPADVDLDVVTSYLAGESYWAAGRSRDAVARSIANSAVVVSAFAPSGDQVGFARVVSDEATFAWLADVFVLEPHRGRRLGSALVRAAVDDPRVASVRRQVLATADGHRLYARFGFEVLDSPDQWMMRRGPGA